MISSDIDMTYLHLPLIYIKDKCTDVIRAVGTDQHDRLYIDKQGRIQYLNLQNMCGTPYEYSFVSDEEGHDGNNLPFTTVEIKQFGLSYYDNYLQSVDLKEYANETYEERLNELFEVNTKLVFALIEREGEDDD